MTLARQTFNIRNTALGIARDGSLIPAYIGCCSAGTVNTVYTFSDPETAADTLGQGPLAEDVCYHLENAGGPVRAVRATGGVAGTTGATDTHSHVSTSTGHVAGAGAAYDAYDITVEIVTSGDVGVGEFIYTLDGGETHSDPITIPGGTTYAIPNTNVTLTFTKGAGPLYYEDGDTHHIPCTAPYMTTTNEDDALDALAAASEDADFLVLSGTPADASAAATMFAALDVDLVAMGVDATTPPAIMDLGSTDAAADVKSAFASVRSDVVNGHYGRCRMLSSKAITGWSNPKRSPVAALAARACKVGLSGDLKHVQSGQLPGCSEMEHDERTATTSLDSSRITTLRSYKEYGIDACYISQGYIHSAVTSVFDLWPLAMIMSAVARTIRANQQGWIGKGVPVNTRSSKAAGTAGANGTIREADAVALEAPVIRALNALLLEPTNVDGQLGHVSDFKYWIDRTYDCRTNRKIRVFFKAVSLAYVNEVQADLSYAAEL